ncbi:MAG: protein kinase [Terriglobia bacterium]
MLVLNSQYEIREPIGRGGMGVVYKAFDRKQKRPVAVKTIRDVPDRAAIQMFRKECGVLASLSHPSIVPIYDIGEFEEDGEKKPFFVMPLLSGNPLDKLMREFSHRLTVERSVEIIAQTCKGLQAAHDKGVIHRDLKPSNIFVLDDDAVTIIDFGVAHMVDTRSTMGQKGSLLYMSPEQLRCEPLSVRSDLFSLGVVCYEAFTRKRPFELSDDQEIMDAILRKIPPPASEVNPAVNAALSRVVHKAMAKQPWSRFSSAREFAEALQKALRNEPLEIFDSTRIQPRIQRARKAYDQGDLQFASEILSELEAEGHLDPEMSSLRSQIDRTLRQKRIQQLLESARTRYEEEEYVLAQQKVQELLEMDPENGPALGLKRMIENTRTQRTVEEWLRLAHQHIDNHDYTHASQALHKVLELQPQESRALQLLQEVEVREQEYLRLREEKSRVFDAAQKAWQNGEISTALNKIEAVLDLDHRAPDTTSPEQAAKFESFYKQVRSDHDALKSSYSEASKYLLERDFGKARALCDEYLRKYPGYAPLQMLKFDVEEQERQALSAFIAETDRQVEGEPDLDKRVSILKEAVARCPGEMHFERALRLARQKQELVNAIVAKARYHEERGQFAEALSQWEILRTVYNQHPGLAFEIERVVKRRDQQRSTEAKARRIQEIDHQLAARDYQRALQLLDDAKTEFPNDPELASLEEGALQAKERAAQIEELVSRGKELCSRQDFQGGLEALREAYRLDAGNRVTQTVFLSALLDRARQLLETDWRLADPLIDEAFDLDPNHTQAKSLRVLASDRKQQESVDQCLSRARRLQAERDAEGAREELGRGLSLNPKEPRLLQFLATLGGKPPGGQSPPNRQHDLEEIRRLYQDSQYLRDPAKAGSLSRRLQDIESNYSQDAEFRPMVREVRRRLETWAMPSLPGRGPSGKVPKVPGPSVAAKDARPRERARLRLGPLGAWARKTLGGVPAAIRENAATQRQGKGLWLWALVLGGLAFAASVVIYVAVHHPVPPPAALGIPLSIETSPSGASIRIAGKDYGLTPASLHLGAGEYLLEVHKDGFENLSQSLVVKEGMAAVLSLALRPLSLKLRLITRVLKDPQIVWDNQPSSKSKDSQDWLNDSVGPGTHTLQVSSRGATATITFQAVAGALPTLSGDLGAKNLSLVTVSTFPGQARVQLNFRPEKVAVDDGPDAEWKEGGIDFPGLASGNHSLTWGDTGLSATEHFEIGSGPELVIILSPAGTASKVPASAKSAAPISAPAAPEVASNSQPDPTRDLYRRAYNAYQNKTYAEAISISKQILQSNPGYEDAKSLRDDSVFQERLLIEDAVAKGDLKAARDQVNVLVHLLPDDPIARDLQTRVQNAEKAEEAEHHLPAPVKPDLILSVAYITGNKNYPGTLKVVGRRLKFDAQAAAGSQPPSIDVACADIKEVKERGHFLGIGQRGFKVQMKLGGMYDFLSRDGTSDEVKSACSK